MVMRIVKISRIWMTKTKVLDRNVRTAQEFSDATDETKEQLLAIIGYN
jgi:hypothetical protein